MLYFTDDDVDDGLPQGIGSLNLFQSLLPSLLKACPKGQACAIVQDEAQGWKGLLFHTS